MRYLLLFFLMSSSAFAQLITRQRECYASDKGIVSSLMKGDIVELQTSLFVLSAFNPKKSEDMVNLQKVTSEVVFSLANTLGAYSDRFQFCSLSNREYYQKTTEANKMELSMGETFDLKFWIESSQVNLPMLEWPLKNIPPTVGHLATNPAIRGNKLPMSPIIENTLQAYARQWQKVDLTDPVQVAALELLGQKQDWDVRKFKPIKFFKLNPENMLNDKESFFSKRLFEEFRPKPFSEKLAILADRYISQ